MGKKFRWWYEDDTEYRLWTFLNALPKSERESKYKEVCEEKIQRFGNIYFYKPIPKIVPYHEDTNPTRLIYGDNGSGKSYAACADDAYEFIGWSPFRDIPRPDFGTKLIWVVTTDYKIQKSSSQLLLFSNVDSPVRDVGLLPDIDYLESEGFKISWENKAKGILESITAPNGTRLEFKSMEQKLNSLAAAPLDYGHGDEIVPKDMYDEVQARLLRKHGRFTLSYLIEEPEHSWTVKDIYAHYLNDHKLHGHSPISFYFLGWEDNVYLDSKDIDERRKRFSNTGSTWRFGNGQGFIIRPRGQVLYEDYSAEIHLKEGLYKSFDDLSTLYRVWDLGYLRPACTAWQIDKYNRKRILLSVLGENIQLRDFIEEIEAKCRELFPRCMSTHEVLPHDARRRPATGVSPVRPIDVFDEAGLKSRSIVYVDAEAAILAGNTALGTLIRREPEVLIDMDYADRKSVV